MGSGPQPTDTVESVMIRAETGCLLGTRAGDVLDVLERLDLEYMPVVDSFVTRLPVGIVARRDLRRLVAAEPKDARVAQVLTAGVPTVERQARLWQLGDRLTAIPAVLVVDQAGALVGYLDLARLRRIWREP